LNLRGGGGTADTSKSNDNANTDGDNGYVYRTVQVQVVHRHGDRTPITPLKNEEFWARQLVPENLLERVASGTRVLSHEDNGGGESSKPIVHAAEGVGAFGKLTKLGLLGMIQVGTDLKDDLEGSTQWAESTTASTVATPELLAPVDGTSATNDITRRIRLTPSDVKIYSTSFARTIQSVQGLLVGIFPDGFDNEEIDIDCRDTKFWMIPDPIPRNTKEQEELERKLAKQPQVLEKEASMRPLAVRCTRSLLPILGEGAFGLSFGVDESDDNNEQEEGPTLSWIQLAEITKCLRVRGMLPDSITGEDQEALMDYTAWKWFQSLRSPRLAYIAMGRFTQTLVKTMQRREQEPPLTVYSCHDSSLVGLMCALHLELPSTWPEYGALMKIELLEKTKSNGDGTTADTDLVLRFFLNGELLRSIWNDEPREEISFEEFAHLVSTVGRDP